jgi:hypothetical protein
MLEGSGQEFKATKRVIAAIAFFLAMFHDFLTAPPPQRALAIPSGSLALIPQVR